MHHGLIFPESLPVTEANVSRATEVYVGSTDDEVLSRGSDSGRLYCPGCLGRLIVERAAAGDGPVSHLRHHRDADPACVFRVNWEWPDDEHEPPKSRPRGEDAGKIVERLLLRALQRNLSDRPGVRVSSVPGRLPEIRIDGLASPAEALSLTAGDEARWQEPFDGRREGRETLFFVASWDLHRLDPKACSRLLARRPWIVVSPARPGNLKDRFAFVAVLPQEGLEWHPIGELDLAAVDYRRLLGIEHPPEVLFFRQEYRRAVAELADAIAVHGPDTPAGKLLRLLAKSLLVNGAAVHRSVFLQNRDAARRLFRASDSFPGPGQALEFPEFWKALGTAKGIAALQRDSLLKRLHGAFIAGYLQDLWERSQELSRDLERSRRSEQELRDQLETARADAESLKKRLAEAEDRSEGLGKQLAEGKSKVEALANEKEALTQEKEKLAGELGRLGEAHAALRKKSEGLEEKLRTVHGHWLVRVLLGGGDER